MTIGLLGASGFTGRLVAAALDARGVAFVPAGRDLGRVDTAVEGLGHAASPVRVDATDAAALDRFCASIDVLVTTVGPFVALGEEVLDAALRNGAHYVDASGEQPFIARAYERDGAARRAGVTAVPACGFDAVPGDLLASVTADAVVDPREVHVAYAVRSPGATLAVASRGTRRSLAALLDHETHGYVHGELRPERLASERRLAWFPKPVGPAHAASVPGGEPLMVPRHHPGVETVRTYVALPSMLAEFVQLGAAAARFGPVRRLADRVLGAGGEGPSPQRRARTRWACVAEVLGADGSLARGWANATDVYGTAATLLADAATMLDAGGARTTGVVTPAQAFEPAAWLDDLADRTDLRWALRRPDATA